ncbi:uncharacterized protein EV420DRAFT_22944 [Desarmillaria tabescens]|uniref:Secreted protein n=1 Tax=Armillaria tabescens TaxID=1929756 RepID=A0AA39NP96_ARMTA|nr:uncharacterized protein EV420DRAFT_22944 [Desarmillaria tabescens]KAK0469306.1 hypothetical protein EV420DRAFT_22944 [Desarmillaria tabescens]
MLWVRLVTVLATVYEASSRTRTSAVRLETVFAQMYALVRAYVNMKISADSISSLCRDISLLVCLWKNLSCL